MKIKTILLGVISALLSFTLQANTKITAELDQFWQQMSATVKNGDFKGYSETYHPDAILVSGISKKSYVISKALAGWKQGFIDTKAGKIKANVEFRFTQRYHDNETAHETGMFNYSTIDENGKKEEFIAHFTALLIKKNGKWLMMMENQKSQATPSQWNAVKK